MCQDARKVVQTWESEFVRAPNMQKKLCMMYLANDILQNSRKKGPEFVNEFYHTVPRPIAHLLKHGDAKVGGLPVTVKASAVLLISKLTVYKKICTSKQSYPDAQL
jgi:hypothetical protein